MVSIAINQPRLSYYVGGAEMISMEHAKAMAELGNNVTIFTIKPASIQSRYSGQYVHFKKLMDKEIKFCEIDQNHKAQYIYKIQPGENRDRWNIESLFFNRSLSEKIKQDGKSYDVLLSYFNLDAISVPDSLVHNNALYLCGVPKDDNIFRASFLAMYDTIIAITDETKSYWQKYISRTIEVISTGVDHNRFLPAKEHDNIFRIIFIGRLIERKGCANFIKAVAKIPAELLSGVEISIVGDGPQVDELKRIVDKLPEINKPRFVGVVDNPESYLSRADICVFPSQSGEGLQGVILEAMSSGAAVIASNTNINARLLGNGRGILIEPDNISNITDEICGLILNKSACHNIGVKARDFIVNNYDWHNIAKDLENSLL